MGRPESQIDFTRGEVAKFAADLRQLRVRAGRPSYRVLASATNYGISTLSEAAKGESLPTLQVTLKYVEACGGDVDEWAARWEAVSQAVKSSGTAAGGSPLGEATGGPQAGPAMPLEDAVAGQPPDASSGLAPGRALSWARLRQVASRPWGAIAIGCALVVLAASGVLVARLGPRPAPATAATVSRLDGKDPYISDCGGDERMLDSRAMSWPDGKPYGRVVLLYSAVCNASWGYVYGPNSPDWKVTIVAVRPGDGATAPWAFQGTARPDSWGNLLSVRSGCVYVEAFVTVGHIRSSVTRTSCFSNGGGMASSPGS